MLLPVPACSARGFPLLHVLTSTRIVCSFDQQPPWWVGHGVSPQG